MSLNLLLGPAASGKSTALVERAAVEYASSPFASTLVLVPTSRHADQLRRHLVARVGAAFNLEVATLGGWSRGLVTATGIRVASRAVAAALLSRSVTRAIDSGEADAFLPIKDAPGLITRSNEAIEELMAETITPAELTATASNVTSAQISSVAAIYEALTAALAESRLLHSAACSAEAAAIFDHSTVPAPPLVLVDGFDYFRQGEARLLSALAKQSELHVALDPSNERAANSLSRLLDMNPSATVVRTAFSPPLPERVAFSVSDRDAELRAIARDIKDRLTSEQDLRPSDFAVSFRQVTQILPLAKQIFQEYNLPIDPAAGFALEALPFGIWNRRLLLLGVDGWRLRDLVSVLRSNFIDRSRWNLGRGHVAIIARHARRNRLWAGLDALRAISNGLTSSGSQADQQAGEGFAKVIDELVPLVEPVREAFAGDFAAALDQALFGRDPIVRPQAEVREQVEAYRALLRTRIEIDESVRPGPVSFAAFVRALLADMEAPTLAVREAGGVVLAPIHTLHGLRFRYVAVGGLVEGEFPVPRRIPGLLGGEVRLALRQAGLRLPASTGASEDELYASAITRADQVLILSRPRIDGDGRPRAASHFFPIDAPDRSYSSQIAPEECASNAELAVALVRQWPTGARRPAGFRGWDTIRSSAIVEARRRSFNTAGIYEGQLAPGSGANLVAPGLRWSATRLESYATCAFQFFAAYGLRLEELDRELMQADPAILGTVVHAIIEEAVRPLVEAGEPLSSATLTSVTERVATLGGRLWEAAPAKYGFGRAELWRLRWPKVQDRLGRMLAEEAATAEAFGVTAVHGTEFSLDTTVELPDGPLGFGGKIDRVDTAGELAVIVDYKSGRPIAPADLETGQRLQLQLYALAFEAQNADTKRVVSRFAYLQPTLDRQRIALDTATPEGRKLLDAAVARVGEIRSRLNEGRFEVMPGPFRDQASRRACPTFCPFRLACRVNHFSRWKRWT